ncbi:sugar transferase [Paenibacillus sp. FJAT-27812]|uniref:sugar transferase n=1 Tax=Paenibacillus sp. FJAT-27812 TaxID=1684143 RepID=UPI0006A7EBF3|nr:sugar transferase [Paenibacillus sp. FJAT-27812]
MKIYPLFKRIVDMVLSLITIGVIWPLFLIIAVIIKLDSNGPIFFKQKRVGKTKRHFYILKFRTMRIDAPKDMPTHMLKNSDALITRSGRFLRKTSLDELPQLINILKGDMSFIGPRPALWNQYDLIDKRDQYGANDIYPGLTGWAQINGRDELQIDEKVNLDGEYVARMSFIFDVQVLIKTVFIVIGSNGFKEGKIEPDI